MVRDLNQNMNALHKEYEANKTNATDTALDVLGDIGDLSVGSFISNVRKLGLTLSKKMSLAEALDAAISRLETAYGDLLEKRRERDEAHTDYVKKLL